MLKFLKKKRKNPKKRAKKICPLKKNKDKDKDKCYYEKNIFNKRRKNLFGIFKKTEKGKKCNFKNGKLCFCAKCINLDKGYVCYICKTIKCKDCSINIFKKTCKRGCKDSDLKECTGGAVCHNYYCQKCLNVYLSYGLWMFLPLHKEVDNTCKICLKCIKYPLKTMCPVCVINNNKEKEKKKEKEIDLFQRLKYLLTLL
jgi:hypothetical protein